MCGFQVAGGMLGLRSASVDLHILPYGLRQILHRCANVRCFCWAVGARQIGCTSTITEIDHAMELQNPRAQNMVAYGFLLCST